MQKRKHATTSSGHALALLVVLVILRSPAFADGNSSRPGQAQKLRIVELEGTPYRMGMVHGQTLKTEIRELVKRWKEDLEKTYRVTAEVFIRNLLKKTDFQPAIKRWTPGLLDEVRGIADGAGLDFDTMYAYQLVDEIWAMDGDLGLSKCTSIAAGKRNGNPSYVAQTLDIPAFYHGFQTVLRIRDKRENLETLVFTIPGVVAANGLNSRSVAVCVNAVTQLAYSPKGLPVAFVIRGILRQESYEQAVRFLQDIQPAAPQNYVIGGPADVGCFERSAGEISTFIPFEGAEFTYHTNHPMINDDFNPRFPEALKRRGITLDQYRALCPRFNYLSRVFKDNSSAIDLVGLKALFQNRASGINNAGTYGCTIMVLGENPELHISPGRPDEEPFQVLAFSPRPANALPGVTFSDKLTVYAGGEAIRLVHFPHAHTDGDAVVFLDGWKVVHMGDMFFNGMFPFLDVANGGDIDSWVRQLDIILGALPVDTKVIPGHGPLAGVAELKAFREMLSDSADLVRRQMKAGKTLEEIKAAGLPEKLAPWEKGFLKAPLWLELVYRSLEKGAGR